MSSSQKSVSFEKLCGSCPHQNCCTNSQEPILFQSDLKRLNFIGKNNDDYLQTINIKGTNVKAIRKKQDSSECIFWDNQSSKCSIYDSRPFDCKAYPFDILQIDGKYHWIVYSCNEESDWKWSEEYLTMLESDSSFKNILENIEIFTNNTERILPLESPKTSYTILREVKNNFIH